jgi:hypothetical protein
LATHRKKAAKDGYARYGPDLRGKQESWMVRVAGEPSFYTDKVLQLAKGANTATLVDSTSPTPADDGAAAVALDLFFVRFSLGDGAAVDALSVVTLGCTAAEEVLEQSKGVYAGLATDSAARQLYHSQILHLEAKNPTARMVTAAEADLHVCVIVGEGKKTIFQVPPSATLADVQSAHPSGNTVYVLHNTTLGLAARGGSRIVQLDLPATSREAIDPASGDPEVQNPTAYMTRMAELVAEELAVTRGPAAEGDAAGGVDTDKAPPTQPPRPGRLQVRHSR